MDFNKFDSRKAAANARPLHLVHPSTGAYLYDQDEEGNDIKDKPCRLMVIGTESTAAQQAMKAARRERAKAGKAKQEDESSFAELQQQLVQAALPLIVGIENINRGDQPATLDDVEWLLNLQLLNGQDDEKSFVEQVTQFAVKRSNFLGNS